MAYEYYVLLVVVHSILKPWLVVPVWQCIKLMCRLYVNCNVRTDHLHLFAWSRTVDNGLFFAFQPFSRLPWFANSL